MATAVDEQHRRAPWRAATFVVLIVMAVTMVGIGWLASVLSSPDDPSLSADANTGIDLTARVAIVNWVLGLGVLLMLVLLVSLVRRWVLALERQASATEAQLAMVHDQFAIDRAASASKAESAEENLRAERFSRAIAQSTGESAALRAIGLLALEELAIDDEEQFASSVYEFLVALLKEKATPDPEERRRIEEISEPGRANPPRIPLLDADAATAVTVLARNRVLFDRNIAALSADTVANGGAGVHLVDVDLSGVWFRGLSLAGATLTNVRLNGAVLVDVDLHEASLTDCRAGDTTFDDVDFTKAKFHSSTFAE
ncbi:MAG: pentapeptide repeat-containing protein, partial [Acidimicrobiales bacterium]